MQQAEQKPQPQPEPWHRRHSRLRLTMVTTVGAQEHVRLTQPPQTGPVILEPYLALIGSDEALLRALSHLHACMKTD